MKVSFITPIKYVGEYGLKSDFILALSHLIEEECENEYEKHIKNTKLPIVLDNGLFENHFPETVDSLIFKAWKIKADSFFAPDFLYDRVTTEKAFDKTFDILESVGLEDLKLNVVIQANNVTDYLCSYAKFAEDDRVNLIGLSILSIPKSFKEITGTADVTVNRIECLKKLNELGVKKNSHLLGAGSSYKDIKFAVDNCGWVVSHDSSSAFWNGLFEKEIQDDLEIRGGKTEVKVDFSYNKELTDNQRSVIDNNIHKVRDICK